MLILLLTGTNFTSKHGNEGLGRPTEQVEGEKPYRVLRFMSAAKTSGIPLESKLWLRSL